MATLEQLEARVISLETTLSQLKIILEKSVDKTTLSRINSLIQKEIKDLQTNIASLEAMDGTLQAQITVINKKL